MKEEIYRRIWTKDGYKDLTLFEWMGFDLTNLHRIDGPAAECYDGEGEGNYWSINGKILNPIKVERWLEENNIDLSKIEDQMAFKLRWM